MTKRIGFATLGRSMQFSADKYGPQGDAEAPQLLERLARRNPDVEWYIIGKSNGIRQWPSNVQDAWPMGISKASWTYTNGDYRCSYCKAVDNVGDCCEKARMVHDVEDYIVDRTRRLDGMVVRVGQHGCVHARIPVAGGSWANEAEFATPYAWARNYGDYIIRGLNALGDATDGKAPVSWLVPDPRNYLKARDIKWPTNMDDILAQHTFTHPGKHERYHDKRSPDSLGYESFNKSIRNDEVWYSDHKYRNAGLEVLIVPDDWASWGQRGFEERAPVGVASTASWTPVRKMRRSAILHDWLLSTRPETPVFGRWDKRSVEEAGANIQTNTVDQFPDLLGSWRSTVSLPPASTTTTGGEWCVAKPYQCFAARVACFMIPPSDAVGWQIPSRAPHEASHKVADDLWSVRDDWTENDLALARWLRVSSPKELTQRIDIVASSPETWAWIAYSQRSILARRWEEAHVETAIEKQLGLR